MTRRTTPRPGRWLSASLAALFLMLQSVSAHAGTICGTVRDAVTQAPVVAAGVFLRSQAGAYLGAHAASDSTGAFCLSDVPAGTYDLEVRVDDYLVRFVRGVVVTDAVTGVDVGLDGPAFRLLAPAPNPASARVRLSLDLPVASPVTVRILDARGRLVRGWRSTELAPGRHDFDWDFLDRGGRRVPAGRYGVRMEAGSIVLHRSIVHVR